MHHSLDARAEVENGVPCRVCGGEQARLVRRTGYKPTRTPSQRLRTAAALYRTLRAMDGGRGVGSWTASEVAEESGLGLGARDAGVLLTALSKHGLVAVVDASKTRRYRPRLRRARFVSYVE